MLIWPTVCFLRVVIHSRRTAVCRPKGRQLRLGLASLATALRRPKGLQLRLGLASLTLVASLVVACSGESTGAPAGDEISVWQSDGQTLVLARPPQRIVSLAPHATEIFCVLGAGDRLVAVDKFANCPAGSGSKPEIDSFQPNLEAIAGMRPDLVYVFANQGGVVEALRRLSIPVLYLEPADDFDGVFENIELAGRLLGREKEASSLVESLQKRRADVTKRVANVSKGPRVFHELDATYFTVRPDTFIGAFYQLLKAENIAAGAPTAFPQLSAEVIIARDPEVIVLADGEKPSTVSARPGWANISAVKNNRLCEVDPDLVSQPGPRIMDGLEALAKCLYPNL